jgi:hypothetical protein
LLSALERHRCNLQAQGNQLIQGEQWGLEPPPVCTPAVTHHDALYRNEEVLATGLQDTVWIYF